MRIYAACLASYNNGKLHGAWIDVDSDKDQMLEEIKEMLEDSPMPDAEEWAIHDTEDLEVLGSDAQDLDEVAEYASVLEQFSYYDRGVIDAAIENFGTFWDDIRRCLEECYLGTYSSAEEWAEDHWDSTGLIGDIPSELQCYIDFKSFADDCEMNGDIWFASVGFNEVHVFSNH